MDVGPFTGRGLTCSDLGRRRAACFIRDQYGGYHESTVPCTAVTELIQDSNHQQCFLRESMCEVLRNQI